MAHPQVDLRIPTTRRDAVAEVTVTLEVPGISPDHVQSAVVLLQPGQGAWRSVKALHDGDRTRVRLPPGPYENLCVASLESRSWRCTRIEAKDGATVLLGPETEVVARLAPSAVTPPELGGL